MRSHSQPGRDKSNMFVVGWKPLDYHFAMPSARIRCLNIIRNFSSKTVQVELFNRKNFTERYDAVIFSKNYSDESLAEAEALKAAGKKVIFDLFDNRIFAPDESAHSQMMNKRLARMIALADHMTTSTTFLKDFLAEHIPDYNITNIEDALEKNIVSPGEPIIKRLRAAVHFFLYDLKLAAVSQGKTRLIWFGTNGDIRLKTGMRDIFKLQEILERPKFRNRFVLTVCSNGSKIFDDSVAKWNIPTLYVKWDASTFYSVLRRNHVALIPITHNPLTHYKTNNRVITSLYNGLAVIADRIPSYEEFEGAIVLDDWTSGLEKFSNPAARARCVQEGNRIISEKYTPEAIAGRWANFLEKVAGVI